jgi:euchromatic histone-lysine N-methyltransferase
VEEVAVPAAVSPVAQNGDLPLQQGLHKVEEAAVPAAVSPEAQNGDLPLQQGLHKVEEAAVPAAVSPVAQNSDLPQQQGLHKVEDAADLAAAQNRAPPEQGQNKVEELVTHAAVSPADCNGSVSHTLPQLVPERAREDGEVQLLSDAGVLFLDGQEEGSRVAEVPAASVKVLESCGIVGAASFVQNGCERAGELTDKEQGGGGSSDVEREEIVAGGDAMEMGDRTGGSDLERKENGVAGSRTKRWMMSALNPPPKKRVVSAVRRFPPGCGRTAITTEDSGVLDVSPIRAFPPGCGRAAVTTTDNGVLEVSPIRTFAPDRGRSSVTSTDNGRGEGLPLEAKPVKSGDAVVAIPVLGRPASSTEASNEKLEGKKIVDEENIWARNGVQILDDFVGTEQDSGLQQNVVAKATLGNSPSEKVKGTHSPHEGKNVARAVVDTKMKNKLEGSIDAKTKGNRLDSDEMNTPSLHNAKASVAGKMQLQRKTSSTKKEVVRSNVNMKQNKSARKLKGDGIGKDNLHPSARESKFGKQVGTNKIEESDGMNIVPGQIIVQALMAPAICPWSRRRKSIASGSKSVPPKNKLKGKDAAPIKLLTGKVASRESIHDETMEDNDDSNTQAIASASKSVPPKNKLKGKDATPIKLITGKVASRESIHDETMEDNDDCNTEGDNSKALVVYEEKGETCVMAPPSVPSGSQHIQPGELDVDARSKVRKLLQLFQAICRKLMQVEEQGIRNVGRVDFEASKVLKNDPMYKKLGPIVGNVPGIEIGDEFHFRVELSIVGLHRPNQAGIDTAKVNGIPVAISIVASGGYPDELSSSDELIYTGSGGKAGGNKEADDQKLERGNLALKNCIETKTPVRVIHGFKGQSKVGQSKVKQTSTFVYDGLYEVVECWKEGPKGEMVFKYKLRRIAGQADLALHAVKLTRKSKVREGLCLPDISHGTERIPICVINTIDDTRPAPFKYITKVIYPPWYEKEPPAGCDCTNGCSDSIKCACVVKNGGEIPFNFNGAIVEARPLVYECGPSCR